MKLKRTNIYGRTGLFFLLLLLATGLDSCGKGDKKAEARRIVAEWTGKEIVFPQETKCLYLNRDTVCPGNDTPYKILFYTDSTGCTSCKLHLHEWKDLIKETEVDSTLMGKLSFRFYFHPHVEKELKFLLKRENFRETVYIDNENSINNINTFPENRNYHCFLLDRDNKVVLMDNPSINPQIWELYKQAVREGKSGVQERVAYTTVEVEVDEIELQDTKINKFTTAVFKIKNSGDVPLLIQRVSASCGCTVPEWEKRPVKPGESTVIKVKVTPDHIGYLHKTVTVVCNTEEGEIPLVVKSTVKE